MTDIHVAAILPPGHEPTEDCACRPIVRMVDRFHGTRYIIHRRSDPPTSVAFGPIHQEASHARRDNVTDPCQACAHSRWIHTQGAHCYAIIVNRAGFAATCPCARFAEPAADPGEVPGPAPQHG